LPVDADEAARHGVSIDQEVRMFIQVLRGRVIDPNGLKSQLDTWLKELSSGAEGWLGSTAGVTDDNRFIGSFRFESAAAAQRNSDRPEQTRWWNETSKYMDTARFWDCDEVDAYKGGASEQAGGSDQAGFVQVIQGRVVDREAFRAAARGLGDSGRSDVIGGVVAWDSSRFSEFVYFTSEEDARRGEKAPPHTAALELTWPLTQDVEYFDLRDPWFASP
jgi:hypothetical protein